jgi:hypothetical protein
MPAGRDDDAPFAHVIRAVGHKRITRSSQPDDEHTKARLVFVQEVIVPMFPNGLPEKRPRDLVRKVAAALARNPKWTNQDWETVSRHTVIRAWEMLSQK